MFIFYKKVPFSLHWLSVETLFSSGLEFFIARLMETKNIDFKEIWRMYKGITLFRAPVIGRCVAFLLPAFIDVR